MTSVHGYLQIEARSGLTVSFAVTILAKKSTTTIISLTVFE